MQMSHRDLLSALVADRPIVFVVPGNFLYFSFFPLLLFVYGVG